MVIKCKDGSVYTLSGPNLLMKSQSSWNKDKINLINMHLWGSNKLNIEDESLREYKDTVLSINTELHLLSNKEFENKEPEPVVEIKEETKVVSAQDFIAEVQVAQNPQPIEIKEETKVVSAQDFIAEVQVAQNPQPIEINANEKMYRIFKERGVEYSCAPVIDKRISIDDLYGEKREYYVYGDKYIFDAIIIDQTDFKLSFWCIRSITVGSIIYRNSRGERWWRVSKINEKTGGYMVECNISDTNPDFS